MSELYGKIAVASTFSPRFLAVLAEADRVARRLGAGMGIIHASQREDERAERFAEAMRQLNRAEDTPVWWSEGEAPAEAILGACREHGVDLLVAGALERESERYFVGGVARELLRRAPCDLLLVPKPDEAERNVRVVAVEVDLKNFSLPMLNRACAVATVLGAERMTFFAVVTPFDEANAAATGTVLPTNEDEFAVLLDDVDGFAGEADGQILRSNTGYAACDFVEGSGADLLIVGARESTNGVRLAAQMDWLFQVIPTNVWVMAAR